MQPPLTVFVVAGPAEGTCHTIEDRDKVSLGRIKTGNALALKDSAVSAKHLQLRRDPAGCWFATDLDSSNGTKLRGDACEPGKEYQLRCGDRLQLGPSTHVLVLFEEAAGSVSLEQKLQADANAFGHTVQAYADAACQALTADWQQQKQRLLDLLGPEPAAAVA